MSQASQPPAQPYDSLLSSTSVDVRFLKQPQANSHDTSEHALHETEPEIRSSSCLPNATVHSYFYFDDGNIVLLSKDNVAFRLYRGLLSRHSDNFAHMLSPGKINEMSSMDGCPIITLQDSEADLSSVFSLLWKVGPENPTFEFIAGALRMSSKYSIKGVREWCIIQLKSLLPHTYEHLRIDPGLDKYYQTSYSPHKIVQLAYDNHLPFLLPLAYYKLSSCAQWSKEERRVVEEYIEPLPPYILTRLLLGRVAIRNMWIEHLAINPILGWDQSRAPPHTSPALKKTCKAGMSFASMASFFLSSGSLSPLIALSVAKKLLSKKLCQECIVTLERDTEAFSNLLFDSLPTIFNLSAPQNAPV